MATVNQFSQPGSDLLRPNKCDLNKFIQLILLIQQNIKSYIHSFFSMMVLDVIGIR